MLTDISDDELQAELAWLLPDQIRVLQSSPDLFWWKYKADCAVLDTEWPYVCYLVRVKYSLPVLVGSNEPWQEQARHILRHMAVHDALMETKA